MGVVVTLYLIVVLPGREPIHFEEQMDSIETCLRQEADFITLPPHIVRIQGGTIQGSCVVTFPPSVEH